MVVEPTDISARPAGVPGLAEEAPAFLSALTRAGGDVTGCTGEVLRPSRFRPVYRYKVSAASADGAPATIRIFIGKADYRTGVGGTFAYMRRLWDAGLRGEDGLGIPEPVAHLEELALLLQTEAPGRCLYELLPTPLAGAPSARNAGRFLGRLHSLAVPDAKVLEPGYEVRKLTTYLEGIIGAAPAFGSRLHVLTDEVLDALAELDRGPAVPTHGDYQPKNIYVDDEQVTVIDWDRGALAHPGRDLGHFLGQCLTMSYVKSGGFGAVRPWNDAFLEGYAMLAPAGWEPAVAPYVARTILEVLYYKLVVKPVADPSFTGAWLDLLEQTLA